MYLVEYSTVTTGRDFGYPARTFRTFEYEAQAGEFVKDLVTRPNKPNGYKPPKVFNCQEFSIGDAVSTHEIYEQTKNHGAGI